MIRRNLPKISLWQNPYTGKIVPLFKPIKLNTKQNIRRIPKKNLTWNQASIRYPKLNPFGDSDRDGKLNMFDCKPFNKKKHGFYVYHRTSKRLLPKILKEGLKPHMPGYVGDYDPVAPKKGVYVYAHPEHPRKQLSPSHVNTLMAFTLPEETRIYSELKKIPMSERAKLIEDAKKQAVLLQIHLNEKDRQYVRDNGIVSPGSVDGVNEERIIDQEISPDKIKVVTPETHRKFFNKIKYAKYNSYIHDKSEQPEALKNLNIQEDFDLNNNQIPDKAETEAADILNNIKKEYGISED